MDGALWQYTNLSTALIAEGVLWSMPKKKNTDEEEKFYFPDGCYLKMRVSTGKVNASEKDERNWRSLDIILLWPSGTEDVLCCFDYEDQKGLRILVYDRDREEPIFEHLVRR